MCTFWALVQTQGMTQRQIKHRIEGLGLGK